MTSRDQGDNFLTELSEEILCCDICCEEFDSVSHVPRILPCYHSFCDMCLEKLHKIGNFNCPVCQQTTERKERFPVDATRVALLELKRSVQSQEGVFCEGCSEGAVATSRCQDCAEFLCADCSTAHHRMKVFRDHTVVSLSEAVRSPEKFLQTSEKCERHADEKLKLFCVTCSKAVCAICALTMHQGHRFVELSSILDERKEEMLSLCGQLDKVEQTFQAKAWESESNVDAVESHLSKAVRRVEGVFSEIINTATERQAQVLEELRAKAKADRLILEERAAIFRSLQAAAQTAADFGRRCVSLSLASQVFSQNPEMKKTIAELREKIVSERLGQLKALMQEIGVNESTTHPSDVHHLPVTCEYRPVSSKHLTKPCRYMTFNHNGVNDADMEFLKKRNENNDPTFHLDATRCGAGCSVEVDKCSLKNQPPLLDCLQPHAQALGFLGTCGTVAVSASTTYWQVRCVATSRPKIKEKKRLCEVGVATWHALQACTGADWDVIPSTDRCALTAWLYTGSGQVRAGARYRHRGLPHTALAPFTPQDSVHVTLGLLLDAVVSRLHVLDVSATRVLCSSDIDLSTPVWPVVRVWPDAHNGARVHVEVQTGQQISLTGDMVRLLQSLLGRDSQ